MAFLYYQHVCVGVGGDGVLILYGQGVLYLEACLNGVVAVYDRRVHVLKGAGQLGCLNLLDAEILGVLGYIQHGSGEGDALLELDEALSLQQKQRAGFVCAVVGYGDGAAVGDSGEVRGLACVDAEGLVVYFAYRYQMGAVLLVEVLEVRGMLEVVGVQIPLLQCGVGQHIVGELHHLKVIARRLELILYSIEYLRMGGDGSAYLDLYKLGGSGALGRFGSGGVGRGRLRLGAGREGQRQYKGQYDCDQLFHFVFLLKNYKNLYISSLTAQLSIFFSYPTLSPACRR